MAFDKIICHFEVISFYLFPTVVPGYEIFRLLKFNFIIKYCQKPGNKAWIITERLAPLALLVWFFRTSHSSFTRTGFPKVQASRRTMERLSYFEGLTSRRQAARASHFVCSFTKPRWMISGCSGISIDDLPASTSFRSDGWSFLNFWK